MTRREAVDPLAGTPTARGVRYAKWGLLGYFLEPSPGQVSGVRQATLLGTVNVLLWLAGLAAIVLVGRFAIGGSSALWTPVGVAVMALLAWRWPWRRRT